MTQAFLNSALKQFEYYKLLGDKTLAQTPEAGLFWQYNETCNSIATIVKHLWGNMLSRWTDLLTTDGEKPWREREAEFDNDLPDKNKVIELWNEGWNCLFTTLHSLTPDDFDKLVYIRNQGHTLTEAINRQIAHYAYHVGQMVYVGKMVCCHEWTSLSIPRGQSGAFNADKFNQPRHKAHFTDEFLANPHQE
ncbi:MAG TPA: DUF1572 family protein [Chitinophagales bacterium]|nr:DUF1572 family protein [Chitinophagales bacterium]HRK28877.1 DUF1572 family protein [Chitinophagales bacterium]